VIGHGPRATFKEASVTCRQQAALDPKNAWRWLASADRWEDLVETEIEDHYRACNANRDELAA
jgi:hypothetical protein